MKTAALEAALNGITITDALQADNPIIYCNPAFKKITGYDKGDILGKNCRFLQARDKDQKGVEKMRRALREGKACHVELRNYKKDGTLFWNEVSINPILDGAGRITHFWAFSRTSPSAGPHSRKSSTWPRSLTNPSTKSTYSMRNRCFSSTPTRAHASTRGIPWPSAKA